MLKGYKVCLFDIQRGEDFMADKVKRSVLAKYMHDNGFQSIPAHEFYREMFPSGELIEWSPEPAHQDETEWRYNAVLLQFTDKTRGPNGISVE